MSTIKEMLIWRNTFDPFSVNSQVIVLLIPSFLGSTNNYSIWMCLEQRFGSPPTRRTGGKEQQLSKLYSTSRRINYQSAIMMVVLATYSWPLWSLPE